MGIITITRQYGSKGSEIGARIADTLGYRLLDKSMASKLAEDAHITEAEASIYEEKGAFAFGYFFQKYFCAPHLLKTPSHAVDDLYWAPPNPMDDLIDAPYFDEDLCAQYTRDIILKEAEEGNVVIVGRGAATLLADRPNTLHICVFASQTYRLRTLMMRYGISSEEAFDKMQDVDMDRMRFVKRHYQTNLEDASNYHVLINSGKMDIETVIQTALESAKHKQVYKTWSHTIGMSS